MAGEWLTATANTNMFTYEIAPVFILMETVVLSKMRDIIGYKGGDSILAPGGSISNLYAFLAARHKMFPGYKEHGPRGLPGDLAMFTSDQCHYSIKSCSSVCGLGTENCVSVPSDEFGHMIPSELERLILERKARGQIPFFVNATAGTTVLGAFDPLDEIADICQKYNCWFHVDVSIGDLSSGPMSSHAMFYNCRLHGEADCFCRRSTDIHDLQASKGKGNEQPVLIMIMRMTKDSAIA